MSHDYQSEYLATIPKLAHGEIYSRRVKASSALCRLLLSCLLITDFEASQTLSVRASSCCFVVETEGSCDSNRSFSIFFSTSSVTPKRSSMRSRDMPVCASSANQPVGIQKMHCTLRFRNEEPCEDEHCEAEASEDQIRPIQL